MPTQQQHPLQGRHRGAGFSLIELMVAIAISAIVSVGIYAVINAQTEAYRRQADVSSIQQNLRIAMEVLTRDVATAGYGTGSDGAIRGDLGQDNNSSDPLYALRIRPDFPSIGVDAVEVFGLDLDRYGIAVTDGFSPKQCGTGTITFSASSASLAANFGSAGGESMIMCYSPSAKQGDGAAFLWAVTGNSGADVQVSPNDIFTDYSSVCPAGEALPAKMLCGAPRYVAFYIDNTADGVGMGTPTVPVLYMVPDLVEQLRNSVAYPTALDVPIAMGIEDMQFSTCDSRQGVDCSQEFNWGFGFDPIFQPATTWTDISTVRISLLARSLRRDMSISTVSAKPDLDSNDPQPNAGSLDGYHRRAARTEVALRNAMSAAEMQKSGW